MTNQSDDSSAGKSTTPEAARIVKGKATTPKVNPVPAVATAKAAVADPQPVSGPASNWLDDTLSIFGWS